MSITIISSANPQVFYAETRDTILESMGEDLDRFEDKYSRGSTSIIPFKTTKRQYIEYMIACVVAKTHDIHLSPPKNVDVLWHMHLLETKSYRRMEEEIIAAFQQWDFRPTDYVDQYIDHSVLDNTSGRSGRLIRTKGLFSNVMGFDDFDDDAELKEKQKTADGGEIKKKNSKAFTVTLTTVGEDHKTKFKVLRTTRLEKVIQSYADKTGLAPSSFRVLWEWEPVDPSQSMADLEVKDGDDFMVYMT